MQRIVTVSPSLFPGKPYSSATFLSFPNDLLAFSKMTATLHPEVWLKTNQARCEHYQDASWRASVYSDRSPEKSSDNEDAVLIFPRCNGGLVMAVADGCGGLKKGELAAQLTIEALANTLANDDGSQASLRPQLLDAIDQANQEIREHHRGSACTLAVAELFDNCVRTYHVGDAQIAIIHARRGLRYISTSHSPVGYAVEAGVLGPREALQHQQRHVVSNFVGSSSMKIEIGPSCRVSRFDRILLASDGLFDNLFLTEITSRTKGRSLNNAMTSLVMLAQHRMRNQGVHLPSKPDDLTIAMASPIETTQRSQSR